MKTRIKVWADSVKIGDVVAGQQVTDLGRSWGSPRMQYAYVTTPDVPGTTWRMVRQFVGPTGVAQVGEMLTDKRGDLGIVVATSGSSVQRAMDFRHLWPVPALDRAGLPPDPTAHTTWYSMAKYAVDISPLCDHATIVVDLPTAAPVAPAQRRMPGLDEVFDSRGRIVLSGTEDDEVYDDKPSRNRVSWDFMD